MALKDDYGVTINSVSYDSNLVYVTVTEQLNSSSTFECELEGTTVSDFSNIAKDKSFKVYSYDSSGVGTLIFSGVLTTVTRSYGNRIKCKGFDLSYDLHKENIIGNETHGNVKTFKPSERTTISSVVSDIVDGSITVGTISNGSDPVGEFEIPIVSKYYALQQLCKKHKLKIYINPTTGTMDLLTHVGSTTSTKHYYFTGANTNAHSSKHTYLGTNICNDVIAIGSANSLQTRFQDFASYSAKTTFEDTVVTLALTSVGNGDSVTLYVASTEGFPSSGNVVISKAIASETGSNMSPLQIVRLQYTSKTSTSLTGTIRISLLTQHTIPKGAYVWLQSAIKVDDNSSFPSSGYLRIGNEVIKYSAKPDSTTFTVDPASAYRRHNSVYTTLSSSITETTTSIPVSSTSSFPDKGILIIYKYGSHGTKFEKIRYTSKTSTSFDGCIRGYDGTHIYSASSGASVFLFQYYGSHPTGVLVYPYSYTGGAYTGSSIIDNGYHTKTVRFENAHSIKQLESLASEYLEQHKDGDQRFDYQTWIVSDFASVGIGDKNEITDSTLNLSGHDVRVVKKVLTIDRRKGYTLDYTSSSYDVGSNEGVLVEDTEIGGAKEGTVLNTGSDTDIRTKSGTSNSLDEFQSTNGYALYSNDDGSAYVFTNSLWIEAAPASFPYNFYCYGFSINDDGVAVFVNESSDPTGVEGGVYYNTTDNELKYYDGSSWNSIGGSFTGYWTRSGTEIKPTTSSDDVVPNGTCNLGGSTNRWSTLYSTSCSFGDSYVSLQLDKYSSAYAEIKASGSASDIGIIYVAQGNGVHLFINTIKSKDILPYSDTTYDLGSSSYRFDNIYTYTLHISDTTLVSNLNADRVDSRDVDNISSGILAADVNNLYLSDSWHIEPASSTNSTQIGSSSYRINSAYFGSVSKNSGSFKIDHPLDPKNKWLIHSFVESPEMMLIYKGRVKLDSNKKAVVKLPDWFHSLNGDCKDAEYSLTPIGNKCQCWISKEINDFEFEIEGDTANTLVSWVVYTVRHDPHAEKNRIQVEEYKTDNEKIGKNGKQTYAVKDIYDEDGNVIAFKPKKLNWLKR